MPKKIDIVISEDLDFLEKSLRKLSGRLKQDRIKTLIYIKKENIATKVILQKN